MAASPSRPAGRVARLRSTRCSRAKSLAAPSTTAPPASNHTVPAGQASLAPPTPIVTKTHTHKTAVSTGLPEGTAARTLSDRRTGSQRIPPITSAVANPQAARVAPPSASARRSPATISTRAIHSPAGRSPLCSSTATHSPMPTRPAPIHPADTPQPRARIQAAAPKA